LVWPGQLHRGPCIIHNRTHPDPLGTVGSGRSRRPERPLSLIDIPLTEFTQSIVKYPNIERFPGGASNDMIPNLQNPKNPLPYDPVTVSKTVGAGGR
jgi:arylsulfatase